MTNTKTISLYAVVRESDGKYFGGFDPQKGGPVIVDSVVDAKLFVNKFEVNLRPDEKLVEVLVTLSEENITVTEPFRPRRRSQAA